jgi:5'-nucleotidase
MNHIEQKFKNHVFFDLDGVLANFEERITGYTGDITTQEWSDLADKWSRTPGFFIDLKPVPGGIEAFIELSKYYDCHILTTAPWENPSSLTEKRLWVRENIGDKITHKKLHFSNHKNLFTGRALIDDRTKNGAEDFNGEHIHIWTEKYPTWESVITALRPQLYGWSSSI